MLMVKLLARGKVEPGAPPTGAKSYSRIACNKLRWPAWCQKMCGKEKILKQSQPFGFNIYIKCFLHVLFLQEIKNWGIYSIHVCGEKKRSYTKAFGYKVASLYPNMHEGVWGLRTSQDHISQFLKSFVYFWTHKIMYVCVLILETILEAKGGHWYALFRHLQNAGHPSKSSWHECCSCPFRFGCWGARWVERCRHGISHMLPSG